MGKRFLIFILSFLILLQPCAGWAVVPNEIKQYEKKEADNLATDTHAWTSEKEQVVPQLLAASDRLAQYAQKIEKSNGKEYLQKLLDTNQLIYEDEFLKTDTSYRIIEKVRVPRIILNKEAYLIIDETILPKDSKHLEQYVSRMFFETRNKGVNVNLVVLNSGGVRLEHMNKPKATDWRWWREYFVSKYKNPTQSDFTLALFTGVVLQGTMTMALSWLRYKYQGVGMSTIPTLWTMGYSILYGTFISSIRNWTVYSGSQLTRVLKSQVISSIYAYGLVMAVGSGDLSDRLATISLFTVQGLAMNISITANGIMNNFVKDYWNQIPRLRESTRVNAGNITFRSDLMNKWFGWRKSSVESQILYLLPWSINVLSLITMASTSWLHIPGTSISVPLFQLAGIPIAMYWSKRYSRKLASEAAKDPHKKVWAKDLLERADEYEKAWKNSFGLKITDIPGRLLLATRYIKSKGVGFANQCMDLLSKKK